MIDAHVLIIGGTSIDTIIQLHSPLELGPQTTWAKESYHAIGGTGAGKALNLAHLGVNVTLHTWLGTDHQANQVVEGLAHRNIELLIEISQLPTEQHTNLMTPNGERISIYTQPPDSSKEYVMDDIAKAMAKTDVAAISILDYTRPTLALAQKFNKPLWIDLHDYDGKNIYHQEFIDAATVIFVASDNLPDYQTFMKDQIKEGKQLVVCTHGKEGSSALDRQGRWYEQKIIPGYELVDSNGAGDAYFSGFIFAYFQGKDIQSCMRSGSVVAAMCINSKELYNEKLCSDILDTSFANCGG
jgi:sugar/nucleoside kinase (ribokinase family)